MSITATRTHLGEQFSEGARLLWLAMEERGWSQAQLAKSIAAQPGVVPRWLYGDRKPSWDWAATLRDSFGISLDAWTVAPTQPFRLPASRDVDSDSLVSDEEPVLSPS